MIIKQIEILRIKDHIIMKEESSMTIEEMNKEIVVDSIKDHHLNNNMIKVNKREDSIQRDIPQPTLNKMKELRR